MLLRTCLLIATVVACDYADANEYVEFGTRADEIVSRMTPVVASRRERDDLRALQYLLRHYHKAVASHDWGKAESIKKDMHVYFVRGSYVASLAEMRLAERARVDAERRHQEEMQQRDEHHREQMKKLEAQKRAIDYLRYLYFGR